MALTTVPASLSATALTLTTAAQPNITSVGTLTGLTVSGNIAGTLTTAAQPNITSVGTLTGLTVSGNIAGTLTTAAQTNITSLGTLSALTISGDLTVDTDTLKVDSSNNRVGISTSTPGFPFHVSTSDTNAAFIESDHNSGTYLWIANSDATTGRKALLGFAPANNIHGATVLAEAMEDFSTSATRTADLVFETRKDGNLSEKMRIQGGGNVGIGETNPQQQLVVKNASGDSQIKIQSGTSNDAYLSFNNGTTLKHYFKQDNTGLFELYYYNGSTGVPRITVKTDGNVGIGTAQPGAPLQINTTSGIAQYIYNTTSAQAYLAFGNSDTGVYPQNFSSAGGILVGVDTDESAIFWNGSNTRMRFGTNGTGRMHITSTGNVLIGPETITPTQLLELHGSNHMLSLVNSSTGTNQYSQMQFKAGSALNWIWGANQNSTAWGGANSLNIQSTSGSIAFYTNGTTQRMRIHETSGNVSIIDGNLIFASGHGIDFSATPNTTANNASTTSELFDDYEEGTWTPYIFGSLSGGTVANTSSNKGGYTKIGNVVTLTFYLGVTSLNGITGTMRMGGLPYTAVNGSGTNQHITTGSMMTNNYNLTTGKNWVVPYISDSATDIKFYQSGHNTGWVETSVHAGLSMIGEIQYRTV